jgi:iron complex outermembrane receptor protein
LLWAGVSRAVRAPSRIDTDFYYPGQPPYFLAGGPGFRSELATVLEVGWRAQATQTLSYSLTAFHSQYTRLESVTRLSNGTYVLANQDNAHDLGLEAWSSYHATSSWSVDAGVLLQNVVLGGPNLSAAALGDDPHAQLSLRSRWQLNERMAFDLTLRHVSQLPLPQTPAYTAADCHFSWQFGRDIALTLTGRNLGGPHKEFIQQAQDGTSNPVVFKRAAELTLSASF